MEEISNKRRVYESGDDKNISYSNFGALIVKPKQAGTCRRGIRNEHICQITNLY